MEFKDCIICSQRINNFGNNALPIIEGQCCDECNQRLVVPMRFRISYLVKQVAEDTEQAVLQNRSKSRT